MRIIVREMRTRAQTKPRSAPPAPAPLVSALFGKSMQAILATLFGRPDEEFYLRELARAAATSPSSLQRDLAALVRSGIVLRATRGHQVYFRANRACPVFDELRGLVVKTFGVADVLTQALQPHVHAIEAAFVYGSVARGDERSGSDIDLFVVGEVSFNELVEALAPAQLKLGREINPTVFAPEELAGKAREGNHFTTAVLADKKLFVIGGEDELESLVGEGRTADAQVVGKGNRRPARAGRSQSR